MTPTLGRQPSPWLDILAGFAGCEAFRHLSALSPLMPARGDGPPVRVAEADAFEYRFRPGFHVDRPHGGCGSHPGQGGSHDSVHFKARPVEQFWDELALTVSLAALANDALGDSSAGDLFRSRAAATERLIQASMFGVVNIFAQAQILEEALRRLETEFSMLESSALVPAPGNTPADIAARLGSLAVAIEEKAARAEANLGTALRLIRESLAGMDQLHGRPSHGA